MDQRMGEEIREEKAAYRSLRRAARYRFLVSGLDAKIGKIAAIRFIAFVVTAASIFSAWYDQDLATYGILILCGALCFGFTVWLHRKLFRLLPRAEAQAELAEATAARLRHEWDKLSEGGERYAQGHPSERELQLFGDVSLFKLVNRTHLRGSQVIIAQRLSLSSSSTRVDLSELKERQEAAQELSALRGLRRRFLGATKQSLPKGNARSQAIGLHAFSQWSKSDHMGAKELRRFKTLAWLGLILTASTIIQALITVTTDLETAWQLSLGAQLLLYVVTTGTITPQYLALISEAHKPLQSLEGCFTLIESKSFDSLWLSRWSAQLNERGKPSHRIREIARYAEALAVRHSALLYGVLAIGLLWELWYGVQVAAWRAKYGAEVSEDLKALYEFEALCSVADLSDDHPDFTWPELFSLAKPDQSDRPYLEITAAAHPLFSPQGRVANDFTITEPQSLYLITGSNMSGKSSFMRAIASNLTLALLGAPVCASRLSSPALTLATSIQVTDDPSRGWSRFYAEVRRIREVVESAECASESRPVLFLIDEMLSGTNSRERRLASRSIATRLLNAERAAGVITTHDLDLATLTERFPKQMSLAHFSDHFDGERLHFDYTLHPGVAQTTNALHVLAMEGIEVSDSGSEDDLERSV